MFWGYHLLLDCRGCNAVSITEPETLKEFARELTRRIAMVPFGEPQVTHFGHGDPNLEGWTVLQYIETSNIMAHFNDHTCEGYIDIFSCRPYDIEKAIKVVREFFDPELVRVNYLTRQA